LASQGRRRRGHIRSDNSSDLSAINIERARDTFGLIAVGQGASIEEAFQCLGVQLGARSQRVLGNSLHVAFQPRAKRLVEQRCRQIELLGVALDCFRERVERIRISAVEAPSQYVVENIRMYINNPCEVGERNLLLHRGAKDLYRKRHVFGGQRRCCHRNQPFYAIATASCFICFASILTSDTMLEDDCS
jgi:hypothetical protein